MATSENPERGEPRGPAKSGAAVPLSIERITHESIPDVCALYKRVWDHFPELPADLVKAWSPSPLEFSSWMEGVVYFSARVDGRTVGVIGCEVRDGSCRIVRLAVDPDGRRKGVGSALVLQAVEWARKSKSQSVWGDALGRFTAAAALLKRLGFDECGVFHRHYFGEDVRLFEKVL